MTRLDRLVSLACYVFAVVTLTGALAVLGILGANIGPLELLVALVLAVPVGIYLARWARRLIAEARGVA